MNIFKSPKARVQSVAPKATCKMDYAKGSYRIDFGQAVKDFNGQQVSSLNTGTCNPADAWAFAVFELRLV